MRESRPVRFARGIAIPAVFLLGIALMFTALQRQMIYFPSQAAEADQLQEAAGLGLQAWRNESGALVGWIPVTQRDEARRMVVFHGNAGYALHRAYFVEGLRDLGWDLYLFEYPGYGARPGTPSEEYIKTAATEALESLLKNGAQPVYLVGESLGSGVATYLAGNFPRQIEGLLLITPFTTLSEVATHHYPWLPVRTLLEERYDSVSALSEYRGPVAFLLAGRDEVVPVSLGQKLHDGYGGAKWLRVEPTAGHNSLPYYPGASWWAEVSDFLSSSPAP